MGSDKTKMFAMAIPLLPNKVEEWKKFSHELLGPRKEAFIASRKKLGVRERTFLQHTPHGDLVVVTLEGENPEEAFKNFSKEDNEFTKWFLHQVNNLHGVDLSQPPPGPLPTLIIDSGAV